MTVNPIEVIPVIFTSFGGVGRAKDATRIKWTLHLDFMF